VSGKSTEIAARGLTVEYVNLGRSGLEVSRFALGSAMFGTRIGDRDVSTLVAEFADLGGNLLDTSNIYGRGVLAHDPARGGAAEEAIGKALRGRRHDLIVATKGYWLVEEAPGPNRVGLSRTYLTRNIETSLQRLGTDYIDLFQCHIWDFYTPIEETLRVLDDLVTAGKIRYVGASNWDAWHVVRASAAADRAGIPRIVSDQVWYCLADRTMEHAILPACRDQGVSTIAWGVLAQGFLSGRYSRESTGPEPGSRPAVAVPAEPSSWANLATERNWQTLDVLGEVAEAHDVSVGTVAMRWPLDAGMCDVVLIGGSTPAQVRGLFPSISLRLEPSEIEGLQQVSEPAYPYPRSFYETFCHRDSPFYGGHRQVSKT
jgi:aryl-alcohol dehydrogenase-like predicted oxidoreductase